MTRFSDLPPDIREKAVSDVFCINCQKSCRLTNYSDREFRGNLFIEGPCPDCGCQLVKPVSSGEHR